MSKSKKEKPLSIPPENEKLKLKGSSRAPTQFEFRGEKISNQVKGDVGKVTLGNKPIICPKCQTENLPTNKFCVECGTLLIFTCPVCESETPIISKFCSGCGQEITVLIKMKEKKFGENDKDS